MGFLVMEVASLAGDVLMRLGQEYQRFGASVAAFRAAGDASLAAAQIRFGLAIVRWGADARAIGARGEGLQPQINPRLLACCREWMKRRLGAGEGDILAIRLFADGDGFRYALQRAA